MVPVLYAGSFDPVHLGHLALVEIAATRFEKVYVAVAGNPSNIEALFTLAERTDLVVRSTAHLHNVSVVQCADLVAAQYKALGVDALLRGIGKDQRAEFEMAAANLDLSALPTLFLVPPATTAGLASRYSRDRFASHGSDDVRHMVPPSVLQALVALERRLTDVRTRT